MHKVAEQAARFADSNALGDIGTISGKAAGLTDSNTLGDRQDNLRNIK